MSDHEIITFCIDGSQACINKKKPHILIGEIYLVLEVNRLQEFQQCFIESSPLQNSVEHNWQMLKDAINTAITEYIPIKYTKTCNKLPWINSTIKQEMKKRKQLYDKAKQTNNPVDWHTYEQMRNEVNLATTGKCTS